MYYVHICYLVLFPEIVVIKTEPPEFTRPPHPDSRAAMRNLLDQYQEEKDQDQQEINELRMRLAEIAADNAKLKESQKTMDVELNNIKAEKESLESDVNRKNKDVTGLKQDLDKFKAEKGDLQEDLKKVLTDKENLQQQLKREQMKRTEKENESNKENDQKKDRDENDVDNQPPPPSPPPPPPQADLCHEEVKILKEGLFKITVTAMEYPKEELKNLRKDISTRVTHVTWTWQSGESKLHMKIDQADDVKKKTQKDAAQNRRLKKKVEELNQMKKFLMLEVKRQKIENGRHLLDNDYEQEQETNGDHAEGETSGHRGSRSAKVRAEKKSTGKQNACISLALPSSNVAPFYICQQDIKFMCLKPTQEIGCVHCVRGCVILLF